MCKLYFIFFSTVKNTAQEATIICAHEWGPALPVFIFQLSHGLLHAAFTPLNFFALLLHTNKNET